MLSAPSSNFFNLCAASAAAEVALGLPKYHHWCGRKIKCEQCHLLEQTQVITDEALLAYVIAFGFNIHQALIILNEKGYDYPP